MRVEMSIHFKTEGLAVWWVFQVQTGYELHSDCVAAVLIDTCLPLK